MLSSLADRDLRMNQTSLVFILISIVFLNLIFLKLYPYKFRNPSKTIRETTRREYSTKRECISNEKRVKKPKS